MSNIFDIAKKLNINEKYIIPFGYDKAKISLKIMDELKDRPNGKLVLVTAITEEKRRLFSCLHLLIRRMI